MGYAFYDTPLGEAGYGVEDVCNLDGCNEQIDRGLAFLCGDQPGRQSEHGCGKWFCGAHLFGLPDAVEGIRGGGMCEACIDAFYEENPGELEREEEAWQRRVDAYRAERAAASSLTLGGHRLHPRGGDPNPQCPTVGCIWHGFEAADDERAGAVGLDDLDLERLAGGQGVGAEDGHGVQDAPGCWAGRAIST